MPFDQVAIYYTSAEPYVQLLYDLTEKLGLKVTFGEGINVKNTKSGRFFFGLLDWIKSNFEITRLIPLINGGQLKLNTQNLAAQNKLGRLLREAGIGWSRERYLRKLEPLEESHELGKVALLRI